MELSFSTMDRLTVRDFTTGTRVSDHTEETKQSPVVGAMSKSDDQVVEPVVARNHPARAGSSPQRF
jgi:hypothetical protein